MRVGFGICEAVLTSRAACCRETCILPNTPGSHSVACVDKTPAIKNGHDPLGSHLQRVSWVDRRPDVTVTAPPPSPPPLSPPSQHAVEAHM